VARKAGANPKETVVRAARAVVKARIRQSIPRIEKNLILLRADESHKLRLIAKAKNNPQIDPLLRAAGFPKAAHEPCASAWLRAPAGW